MLGTPTDLLFPDKFLPRAQERLNRLAGLFNAGSLTIHVAITSHFEYVNALMKSNENGKRQADMMSALSWSDLIGRLRAEVPDSHFVVWDFEKPEAIALAYVISMLGIDDEETILALHCALSKANWPSKNITENYSAIIRESVIARLDDAYEIDIHNIEKMNDLSVVRWSSIPKEFCV